MSFQDIRTDSLPAIDSYAKAAAEWAKTKPIRGRWDSDFVRALGWLRAVDRFAIIKRGDSYAMCYHNNDVVTYHPDDSITLQPWASRTTDQFANRLLPLGVEAWFACALGRAVILTHAGEKRLFLLGHGPIALDFDPALSGYVLDNAEPVEVYGINRKRANAALRATRYGDFVAWLRMKENLEPDCVRDMARTTYGQDRRNREVLAGLEQPDKWPVLGRFPGIEDDLRTAIYADAGDVVTCEKRPYLAGVEGAWGIYGEVRKIMARQSRYRFL